MNYLDTSALIKRLVRETGSGAVAVLVRTGSRVATSKVAYAEVFAALARRRREGDLAERSYRAACSAFETQWASYIRVELSDEVLERMRVLVAHHPLRGFDAIHLASALDLRDETGVEWTFAGADRRQLEAARAEGLSVIDVAVASAP
jgi:predicted nucleic acid-binding protein